MLPVRAAASDFSTFESPQDHHESLHFAVMTREREAISNTLFTEFDLKLLHCHNAPPTKAAAAPPTSHDTAAVISHARPELEELVEADTVGTLFSF